MNMNQNNININSNNMNNMNQMMPNMNPMISNMNPMISNMNPMIQNMNPMMSNINPMMQNMNPMMSNINPMMPNMNPMMQNMNMINNNQNFLNGQIQFNPNEFINVNNQMNMMDQMANNQFNFMGNIGIQQSQNKSQNNKNEEINLKFANNNDNNKIINIKCKFDELFEDIINRYWYTINIKNPPEAKYTFKSKNLPTFFTVGELGLINDNIIQIEIKKNDKKINETDKNKLKNGTNQYILVTKWIDYSSKYGLGYLLNNGYYGVYFNDGTKIILNPNINKFYYIEKYLEGKKDIDSDLYNLDNYPENLKKKVTLLSHFKNYLENQTKKDNKNSNSLKENIIKKDDNNIPFIYVKKWIIVKYGILFKLTNKIFQLCFNDKTELVLSSENKLVIYSNKNREKSIYSLNTALNSDNEEMVKKLKYTKVILERMLAESQKKKMEKNSNK